MFPIVLLLQHDYSEKAEEYFDRKTSMYKYIEPY
jgi:hypothetical protein